MSLLSAPFGRTPHTMWTAALALALLGSSGACGDSNEGALVTVQAGMGVMDCPSEYWQHSTGDYDPKVSGAATADAALALLTTDPGLPPGMARVQLDTGDRVLYLFLGPEGERLGRVEVNRATGGWIVTSTERCG